MPLAIPRVVLVLATILLTGACDDDQPADPQVDTQGPDGGSGTDAKGGAGGVSGRAGTGGASNAGRTSGSSGRGGTSAADGGIAGASESGGASGAAGRGGMSASGGSGDNGAGSGDCPSGLEGPALVHVPAPDESTVSSYCIDATEVTNAHYAAFLDTSVATTEQDEACAWNTTYTPSRDWPATGKDNYPVANVDWCDAFAFCKWSGKHLCGKIGGGESHFSFDYDDATRSEWFNACSAGETSIYPYGDEYDESACVGIDFDMAGYQPATDLARAVATPTCVGAYDGLYDLSGNVWEWENSCNGADLDDGCHMRGGASNSQTGSLVCDYSYDRERDFVSSSLGFRCCTDANAQKPRDF